MGDLDELYQTYFDDVYKYLLFFTNNQNDAEDLTQETFIKVFRKFGSFQHKSSVKTWIYSIAKNIAIDYFRKKKTLSFMPDFFSKLNIADRNRTDEQLEKMDDWEGLQQALLKLKSDHRNVIILRGLQEMSTKETAEILGWTESKVKVTYHRALKEMKRFVQRSDEGGWLFYEEDIK